MKNRNFALLILALILLLLPSSALANKAGLVIRKSTGEIKTVCVEFSQSFISGEDLLEMSGLNPVFENKFLVEIDSEKSKNHEYLNDDDLYWSYWIYDSVWKYANTGAAYTKVYDQDVHGWQFAQSKLQIPPINFNDICVQDVIVQETTVLPKETDNTTDTPKVSNLVNPTNSSTSDQVSVSSQTVKPNIVLNNPTTQDPKNQPVNISNLATKKLPYQNFFKFSLKNIVLVICGFFILGLTLFWIKFFIHHHKRNHLK